MFCNLNPPEMSCPSSLLPALLSQNFVRWRGLQTGGQVRLAPLETRDPYQHQCQHHHEDDGHDLVAAELGAARRLGLLDARFVGSLGGEFLGQALVLGAGGPGCLHASTRTAGAEHRAGLNNTRAGTP